MADLSAKKRSSLPKSDFGLPNKAKTASAKKQSGNYPMPDKKHARAAKSLAAKNATPAERKKIDAKADKILKKGK